MAHLDVRERRIEATIAYLGPDLAGKTTNLRRLAGMPDAEQGAIDDVVAIDWRPVGLERFDGCDVAVRVVAPRGAIGDDDVTRTVAASDGVVVVLDADPAARDRNRAWLASAREHLAFRQGMARTVVVQFNKLDLPEALPVEQLAEELGVRGWPHVGASAARGEGVVETVRCALEAVLGSLAAAEPGPAASRRADAHPLLTALRDVLRESIDERVGAIEARIDARLSAMEARIVDRVATEVAEAMAIIARDVGAELAALQAPIATVRADVAATRVDLRGELARLCEEERDRSAAAVATLRRGIDTLRVDLKPVDPEVRLQGLETRLAKVADKVEEIGATLAPTAATVRSMPLRLGEAQDRTRNALLASIDDVGRRVERTVEGHAERSSPVWQRVDERSAKVEAAVDELLDELKKRKKGWFG